MIKKNTTVIFENGADRRTEDLAGGMPLSKGEVVKVHEGGQVIEYEVADKTVDCFLDGADQTVEITYTLRVK